MPYSEDRGKTTEPSFNMYAVSHDQKINTLNAMVLGIGSLESAEIYQRCLRQIFNIQTYFNERLYRKTYQ